MKAQITFTLNQAFWLVVLSFYWGGTVSQFVTGYVSTLGVTLNSVVTIIVLALIVRSALKRSFNPPAPDGVTGVKGSAA